MRRKRLLAFMMLTLIVAGLPSTSSAAFPGVNGKIVFDNSDNGVSLISPDGRFREDLPTEHFRDTYPEISPDGTRIVAVIGYSIRTFRLDGTDERVLYSGPADTGDLYFSPTWSPDGSRVAFGLDSIESANRNGTWIVNADGSAPEKVYEGALFDFEWSPTADVFVYISKGIATVPIGSLDFEVVSYDSRAYNPSWSPDGTEILFSTSDSQTLNDRVVRINADGTDRREVVSENGGAAAWSPDGTKIAYSPTFPAFHEFGLRIVDLATGQITETQAKTGGPQFHLDWGPCAAGTDCNAEPPPPPPPGPQEHERTVTLSLSSHILARGVVAGDEGDGFHCGASTPLKLQRRQDGRWRTVGTVPTSSSGPYDIHLPDRPGLYRAKLPRVTSPDGTEICLGARSDVRRHSH